MSFERELVKQSILPDAAFPHHVTNSDPPDRIESAQPSAGNPYFFNGIGHEFALATARLDGSIAPEAVVRLRNSRPFSDMPTRSIRIIRGVAELSIRSPCYGAVASTVNSALAASRSIQV